MQLRAWFKVATRPLGLSAFCLAIGGAVAGCSKPKESAPSVAEPPSVQIVQPQVRTIVRTVGQPSFVASYEHTSIFPKVNGYIKKWNVDIGDKVKKDQVLCTLFVPELEADLQTKRQTVRLDAQRVELALKMVKVAEADVKAAAARLTESKAILGQYQAQLDRWAAQSTRINREVGGGTVDIQTGDEVKNQYAASTAARDAAKASIQKAEAELLSKEAAQEQAVVAVHVARASLAVADSEVKRLEAWNGYLTLKAPYDGIIVARNTNDGDLVMPSSGDPSADHNAPHLAPNGQSAPLFVVERTDIVRVFVDIPEQDANYVTAGTKANVLIRGFRDQTIPGTVTRTAWALNVKSRTLRAEVDLPNTDSKILPGMYAYGKVVIERPNVLALPVSALISSGEKQYFWKYENGKAVKHEVQTGISDGEWIEITNKQLPSKSFAEDRWEPVTTSEQVILGDLTALADGSPVQVGGAAKTNGFAANTGH
jgi:multidrug efflux pump subunit AcrA (membrane-fusion protein)